MINLQLELEELVLVHNSLVQEYLTKARSNDKPSQKILEEMYSKSISIKSFMLTGVLNMNPQVTIPPKNVPQCTTD